MTWHVVVRCEHGIPRDAVVDDLGHVVLPEHACPVAPRPGRLRVWWEARRLRRALDRWRPDEERRSG